MRPKPSWPSLHSQETFDWNYIPNAAGALAGHWITFRAMLIVLLGSFGYPARLLKSHLISRADRKTLCEWLRGLEALLRRILLIAAADDARPLVPFIARAPRAPAAKPAPRGHERALWTGGAPSAFAVHFALAPPRDPRGVRRDGWGFRPHVRPPLANAAPLFARVEAVIRVFKDPALYVMRLRQKLARDSGHQAYLTCIRINLPPARVDDNYRRLLLEFWAESVGAARRLLDTS